MGTIAEDSAPRNIPRPGIDKAAWHRFSADNKDRCEVCGKPADFAAVFVVGAESVPCGFVDSGAGDVAGG